MATNTTPKKISPLSYNSPRTSPFKRADSSASRNNSPATLRASPHLPRAPATPTAAASSPAVSAIWSPRSANVDIQSPPKYSQPPQHRPNLSTSGDPLAKLQPAQLREMRESFQVLDRNNDGQITKEDVEQMLTQLGPDGSAFPSSRFFFSGPSGSSINLSTYLHTLSSLLAPMSRTDELSAAFSAFDVDDSGQIDVRELREALLRSAPEGGGARMTEMEIDSVIAEYSGRRAFKKGAAADLGKPRGEIFRYRDFAAAIEGGKSDGTNEDPQLAVA